MSLSAQTRIDRDTLTLLERLEATPHEAEQQRTIERLADRGDSDSCRVLISVFHLSMWRSTRLAIIRSLGRCDQQRGVEFLLRQASQPHDFALAAEAVLALGRSNNPAAGEFLLTVVEQPLHPLRREAVLALSNMRDFPCDRELAAALADYGGDLSPGVLQYLILSVGRRGHASSWPALRTLLTAADTSAIIFNAVLLATSQIGGEEALADLRALDLPYRFFADELRLAAIERIEHRLTTTMEEVVLHLLATPSAFERWPLLFQLRLFPENDAWHAFEQLADGSDATLQCLVRRTLFHAARIEDDVDFLCRHAGQLDPNAAASLISMHVGAGDAEFSDAVYSRVPRPIALTWMERARDGQALARLGLWLTEGTDAERVQVVNAFVAQAHMAGRDSPTAQACGEQLFAYLENSEDSSLSPRIIRALGQIGYCTRQVLLSLEKLLRKRTPVSSSIYSTLAAFGTPEAALLVLRRLRRPGTTGAEMDDALSSLSKFGSLPSVEALDGFTLGDDASADRRRAMLLILSANPVPGFTDLILQSLDADDFQTQMLALAAAKWNHDPRLWDVVFRYISASSHCLQGRALDTLCYSNAEQQLRLAKHVLPNSANRELALKLLHGILPRPGGSYRPLIVQLDRWVSAREGVFADRELSEAAVQLRDRCAVQNRPIGTAQSQDPEVRRLDSELAEHIPGFAKYGEMVRSALRSAELTYRHPELFGERVDKSSAVVEYVKAIDLLLQEYVGGQLFGYGSGDMVIRMQSRVVQLQLTEEALPVQRVLRDLQCESFFSSDSFPLGKLAKLAANILSGKIAHDQMRAFDGLRAWSIALLLFGRSFQFRSMSLAPLLKVAAAEGDAACELAAQLNVLQDERNDAAHRGTLVRVTELGELRQRSLLVLSGIDRLLAS